MKASERRDHIIKILTNSKIPVTGKSLADELGVSRQVIVQDIALLRAEKYNIISTTNGYVLEKAENGQPSRVFKVHHNEDQVDQELNLIVDFGGYVQDVFVFHKVYGTISAKMNIRSREDVNLFMQELRSGRSSLLMNCTSGYHYHTVSAPTVKILDLIQSQLEEHGFLAKLQDYEPVDFWKDTSKE